MLSRTADHLYWMARYMERAENTARMLDVTLQTALLPQSQQAAEQGWRGLLGISELLPAYTQRHGPLRSESVLAFMVLDSQNPASIHACLQSARENARAVRGTLTSEVWETMNSTWLEFQRKVADGDFERDPSAFFEWVKFRAHLGRGVALGTMLRDEAMQFWWIGLYLERADNTARLLDAKFLALASEAAAASGAAAPRAAELQAQSQASAAAVAPAAGGSAAPGVASGEQLTRLEFYHWAAVLRSVSAFEIYRKVYRNVIAPERVAELLILRPDMPRSLTLSVRELNKALEQVANQHSDETLRLAGRLNADLQFGSIDEILEQGLHDWLTRFLERINQIGVGISRDFLVPMAA